MRSIYADCFSGVSGDMILGALLDLGVDQAAWMTELCNFGNDRFTVNVESVERTGITGKKVNVQVPDQRPVHGTHLADIIELLQSSDLSPNVQHRSAAIFTRIADAEGKIHGVDRNHVHFHEVGAADAIADIVGACIGLEMLGVESIACSNLPFARGWVKCQHGIIPTPAPATLALLNGFTWYDDPRTVELITPTGAGILAEYVCRDTAGNICHIPPFRLQLTGYGAGSRESERPNLLRLCLIEI